MAKWMITLLNMSLNGSYVICAVLLLRLVLKKAPRQWTHLLWTAAWVRLLWPGSFQSAFSALPFSSRPLTQEKILYAAVPQMESGFAPLDTAVNAVLPQAAPGASLNPMQVILTAAGWIWLVGVIVLALWQYILVRRLRQSVKAAVWDPEAGAYICSAVDTPFVMGIFRPRIYLPEGLSEQKKILVLSHEKQHLRRCDPQVRLVQFTVLCLHWFNPLVWAAVRFAWRDMETACDEQTLRKADAAVKKAYCSALLELAAGQGTAQTVVSFGEEPIKERISHLIHWKKAQLWVTAAAAVLVTAGLAALVTSPPQPVETGGSNSLPQSRPQLLYSLKTPYVGDAAATGAVVSALEWPENMECDHIALQTAAQPYGVTLFLSGYWTDYGNQNADPFFTERLRTNADLLFALVENIDTVVFEVNKETVYLAPPAEEAATTIRFVRKAAEEDLGAPLSKYAESEAAIQSLMDLRAEAENNCPTDVQQTRQKIRELGLTEEELHSLYHLSYEPAQIAQMDAAQARQILNDQFNSQQVTSEGSR